jgi:putative transcriptional regulator
VRSLRGHLIVAGAALEDPSFRRTVVLLGEHGEDGAMGIVLNRASTVTVPEAVPPLAELAAVDDLVYIGGPVQPQAVVVLADFRDPERADVLVVESVGFLPAEVDELPDVGDLRRVRVFAGYAGWAPGQLEDELAEGSWVVLPSRVTDVFTEDPDGLWSEVLRREGGGYAVLSMLPDDPIAN